MNIYLTGMPGSGKTSIGVLISEKMGIEFADTDRLVTQKERRVIPDIFKMRGEAYFRKIESECLAEVSKMQNTLVSTGGGTILDPQNVKIMKNTGKIIFIDTPPENILQNSALKNRPILHNDKTKIFELYNVRYPIYVSCADYTVVNIGSIEDVIAEVERIILSIKR